MDRKPPDSLFKKHQNKLEATANLLDMKSIILDTKTYLMTSSNDGVIRMYEFYNDIFRPVRKS